MLKKLRQTSKRRLWRVRKLNTTLPVFHVRICVLKYSFTCKFNFYKGGIMDQFISTMGQDASALLIDCR